MSYRNIKKWDKDLVHKIALNYKTKTDFYKGANTPYRIAKKNGWFDDVTSHMFKLKTLWTNEMIKFEAKKYNTLRDFKKESTSAYDAARVRGILHDVTSHMVPLGNLYKRFVYVYEFSSNHAYVGLTYDFKKRDCSHRKTGPVYNHICETGLEPVTKFVVSEPISVRDAQKLEESTIQIYKQNGWVLLNTAKPGALGGTNKKWSKSDVQKEADKYNRRIDFQKFSNREYSAALRNGWLNEVCTHMVDDRFFWKFDDVMDISKQYHNLSDFYKNSSREYYAALRNGWLIQITSHMKKKHKWDELSLKNEMLKYDSIADLKKNYPSTCSVIYKRLGSKFINDFYGTTPKVKWTPELLKKEVQKYNTRLEFLRGSESAYKAAQRQGILQNLIKDMQPDFQWTEDNVREESKKYKKRSEFKKGSPTAFKYAYKWGILNDLFP